jgi:hypothetical protein
MKQYQRDERPKQCRRGEWQRQCLRDEGLINCGECLSWRELR